MYFKKIILSGLTVLVVSGCVSYSQNISANTEDDQKPLTTSKHDVQSFEDWKLYFKNKLLAQGFNKVEVDELLSRAHYQVQTVTSDRSQAEFVKMPWEYLDSALSTSRINLGKKAFSTNRELLTKLQQQYQVPDRVITAIWGMESGYGGFMGKTDLISALATLAYDGRRAKFAESQLIAILKLVDEGSVDWSELKGSWAGGMGHTQFIPSTFLAYGVDGNQDGKRDPWVKEDALASTANYLHRSGWNPDISWGYEVRLSDRFDYRYLHEKLPLKQWKKLGIRGIDNIESLNEDLVVQLFLPAGKEGPAFLLTANFDVIKVYNNSSNYALAVGLLSDAIVGKSPAIKIDWPRSTQPLSKQEVKALQERLNQLGFNTNGVDGILGVNTRKAFGNWQRQNHQVPDEFIHQESAKALIQSQ